MAFKDALLTALFCCAALPAAAQTELDLSATGQVLAQPDEMTASLQAQATAPSAAAAQAAVNETMQRALQFTKNTQGVTATTGGYNVFNTTQDNSKPPVFQATQELDLVMPAPGGAPPPAFAALAGQLQKNGLLLNNFSGDLSRNAQQRAENAAIADGLDQIQAQAAAIAAQLHESVRGMKSLSVNANTPVPLTRGFVMAAAAPAPQAAPGKITVTANLSATIELGK